MIYIQYEFDSDESWLKDGIKQVEKREKKGKPSRDGVKVNDRSLIKKLQAKKGFKKVELVRVLCFAGFETTLLGVQGIYRSHHSDGTVREVKGTKHYFSSGELSFKTIATYDTPSNKTKLSFERQGCVVKAQSQGGSKGRVSPSCKMCFLRG